MRFSLFFYIIYLSMGQEYIARSFEMKEFHDYGYTKKYSKQKKVNFRSPTKVMAASFIIPGLGQYMNDDDLKALLFIGIEAISWSIYVSSENRGDDKTKEFEHIADTKFSRIKYYRALANESGHGVQFESLVGSEDFLNEEITFNELKNSNLWATLRDIESQQGLADGVHTLPETKTQQYYEMIGKYAQFFVGWMQVGPNHVFYEGTDDVFVFDRFSKWKKFKLYPRPDFITSYYDVRNSANDFYKKADWALRGIFLNHLLSGLEALITSKRRLKTQYQSKMYKGEVVPSLTFSYEL